jgi:hypothetical protein
VHLLTRRVIDLDRLPPGHPGARLAVRAQPRPPQLPGEADIHITAERALTTLKDAGLITPVIGKGYYVAGT